MRFALRLTTGLTVSLLVGAMLPAPAARAVAEAAAVLPGAPTDIVFSPNGTRAYTANGSANSVSVIDTGTMAVLQTYHVEDRADIVSLSPDGLELAVGTARQVTFITLSTGAQRSVGLGQFADGIVYQPDGSGVWISAWGSPPRYFSRPDYVGRNTMTISQFSEGLTRNPRDGRLWVATDNQFIEFNGSTAITTRTTSIDWPRPGLAFTPFNERVFAPRQNYFESAVAIDLAHSSGLRVAVVPRTDGVEARRTLELVTSIDGRRLFGRTPGDTLVVIDPLAERELDDIVVGGDQTALAVHPTTGDIWTGHDNPARITITPPPSPIVVRAAIDVTVTRIGEADRFSTAAAVSESAYPEAADGGPRPTVVYLATGASFADALSAAPAAIKNSGVLLLTGSSLPASTRAELLRLNPPRVVLVGGTGVVTSSVESTVRALLPSADVDRISGPDRYATSIALIRDAWGGETSSRVYLATGRNFPDALSGAPIAGSNGSPVLLVDGLARPSHPEGSLSSAAESLLSALETSSITALGGTGTISYETFNEAVGYDPTRPTDRRLWGTDRYRTSHHINGVSVASADTVYLASGVSFPDALAGSVLAGLGNDPLYIVPPTCVPQGVIDEIDRLGASKVVLLGGPGALGSRVASLSPCG
jgi:YVTN family beta-propeller protein